MDRLVGEISAADLRDKADSALDVLIAAGTTYGLRVLGAIAILVIGFTIARIVFNTITRACKRHPRLDPRRVTTPAMQLIKCQCACSPTTARLTRLGDDTARWRARCVSQATLLLQPPCAGRVITF